MKKNNHLAYVVTLSALLMLPEVSFAQNLTYVESLISQINDILNQLVPVIIGIGVVVFLWGAMQLILAGDDTEKRASGKKRIIWGILGIFVMVSLWGIIALLQSILFPPGPPIITQDPPIVPSPFEN